MFISRVFKKTKLSITSYALIAIAFSAILLTGCSNKINSENMVDLIYSTYSKMEQSDSALVSDTSKLAIDLKNMEDFNENSKEKLKNKLGEETEKIIMFATVKDLIDQGEIDSEELYWRNGVVYTFELLEKTDDTVKFNCQLWRSGLGAVASENCKAKWNGKSWDIEFGIQSMS